ncbi:sporulation protein [Roseateles sp. BYS180W]|uniref:Sporulation protein n=1 Tax=Roseateles rivi TaxID=3299028 RepID=A0ABW7FTJ1_9BURK
MKKLFAAVGVGGAKVDTVLVSSRVRPGEVVRGEVRIQGGAVDQDIEKVDVLLMAEVEQEAGDHEVRAAHPLRRYQVAGRLHVRAGQTLALPFELLLPLETPVNNAQALTSPGFSGFGPQVRAAVWLHTDLAIASALDAKDRDFLDVLPLPQMERLIAAMAQLGFVHVSTDVEYGTAQCNGVASSVGCYQEFEFKPLQYGGGIKEVEITCIARAEGVHVLLEMDRRFRGDSYRSLVMGPDWAQRNWVAELQRVLQG